MKRLLFVIAFMAGNASMQGYMRSGSGLTLEGDWQAKGSFQLGARGTRVFEKGARIRGSLGHSDLAQALLSEVDFENVDFEYTNLQEADFTDANLKGAKLNKAKVAQADFRKALGLTAAQKADLKKRGALV